MDNRLFEDQGFISTVFGLFGAVFFMFSKLHPIPVFHILEMVVPKYGSRNKKNVNMKKRIPKKLR